MASVYLVLKLKGMNPQYCTGFENACVSWGGGGGECRVKNWYFSLKDSEYKIQKKKNKKTEHSEIGLLRLHG